MSGVVASECRLQPETRFAREAWHDGGEVRLAVETSDELKSLELGPGYRVAPVADFFAEFKALLGEAAVS